MQSHNSTPAGNYRVSTQSGVSLVELIVAMAVGMVLLVVVTTIVFQQNTARGELDKSSRMIENGRYAMQVLNSDIQMAGFWGEYDPTGTNALATALSDTNWPCSTSTAILADGIPAAVQGFDSATSLSACGISNYKSGTDILIIRRADTSTVPISSATPTVQSSSCSSLASGSICSGQVYVQSGLETSGSNFTTYVGGYTGGAFNIVDATGTSKTSFSLTDKNGAIGELRKFHVTIYYIASCNVCSGSDADTTPTLKKIDLSYSGGSPVWTTTALVEGIENMQIDYGMDTNGDGAPDSYTDTPPSSATGTATDVISNVMTVKINILARNDETTSNYTDTKTYTLGLAGSVGPFNDAYKRHVFTSVIRLINPSGRLEN